MLKPRLHAAWFLAVAATAAIALVSGTVFVIAAAVGGDDGASAVDEPWQRSIAWPTGVRRTDENSALIAYDVPSGQPDCVRNPEARVASETAQAMHVSLTYELSGPECTETVRGTITVSSRWLLRARTIVVNGESWMPGPNGYRRCAPSGCAAPLPAHCSDGLVSAATETLGTASRVRACTDRWLVADVTADSVRRWFFEFRDGAWQPLLGTRNPGCSSVGETQPAFPESLCRDLPGPR